MKGDFARFTFDPTLHYSQVLQQQGRVLLDADWNEQGRIQLHLLRTLIRDLVGPCWAVGDGFTISTSSSPPNVDGTSKPLQPPDWLLKAGHFYVDGILCVNEADCTLASQPNAPTQDYGTSDNSSGFESPPPNFALYLDVWERHLCAIEAPGIADTALDGIDTASRAQVVWQVRMLDQALADQQLGNIKLALSLRPQAATDPIIQQQLTAVASLRSSIDSPGSAKDSSCSVVGQALAARATYALPGLSAKLGQAPSDSDPCVIAADARYRGCENQLYRVEIHQGGLVGTAAAPGTAASFKWSRENGSVVFPILLPSGKESINVDGSGPQVLTLARLGRDARLGLAANDWVELVDDDYTLAQRAHALRQVIGIDLAKCEVTLAALAGGAPDSYPLSARKHPLLRRWDHGDDASTQGAVAVVEGTTITLEDNIQITFAPGGLYATGDYWLIPARVAGSGMLYWPTDTSGNPASLPPRGLHHYAMLGVNGDGSFQTCCCRFDSLCAVIQTLQKQQPGTTPSNAVLAPSAAAKVAGKTIKATKKDNATPGAKPG